MTKKLSTFGILFASTVYAIGFAMMPMSALAAKPIIPDTVRGSEVSKPDIDLTKAVNAPSSKQVTTAAVTAPVALLTIFADPTYGGSGSSGSNGAFDFGTHAFITVRNVSNSNMNVGRFSGIAPGKTMSIGTWGNKSEHTGLWYELESYFVYNNSAYQGRISVAYLLDSGQLNTLNSYITYNDYWSTFTNCSSFAVNAWNNVVDYSYRLGAGVPNTPKNLANSIKAKWPNGYSVGASVTYNYLVYYANGTGSPIRSTIYR